MLARRDDLRDISENPAFIKRFGDVIYYRAIDYYRRRYMRKDDIVIDL